MKLRVILPILLLLTLSGCDQQSFLKSLVPKQQDAFAKNYLALFPAHNFSAIEASLVPSLRKQAIRPKLAQIMAVFPAARPTSIKTVGFHVSDISGVKTLRLTYEYHYPEKWLLATIALNENGKNTTVSGVHVRSLPASLEQINHFSFAGKGLKYLGIFGLAIFVPLFIVFAIVQCIRTPIPKRKWLWILFIVFGVTRLSLDWTSGALHFSPAAIQLLGSGFIRSSVYGPVYLFVSLPLGAIIFLLKRKKWLTAGED